MTATTHSDVETDRHWMLRARDVAEGARIQAAPNPSVGCVLVQHAKEVGAGCTQAPGQAHAEVVALQQAGAAARGATAYVTLEPCCHHGRTPPCVDALIAAGVARVVVAIEDPDSQVAGNGVRALRDAGIQVDVGVCSEEVFEQLRGYLHQRKTGSAYCLAKVAVSVDGRTAAEDGSSQWITCPEARADTHLLRAQSQAILVGVGTALVDKPKLTVRIPEQAEVRQPLRVLVDSRGSVAAEGPLFDTQLAPTLVLTTEQTPSEKIREWKNAGAEVEVLPELEGRVDMSQALKILGQRDILQVMVEGGATLLGSLANQSLINSLVVYVGPKILGDSGTPMLSGFAVPNIDVAPTLQLTDIRRLGNTSRLEYLLNPV